jgi:hypothetical protein
MRIRNPGPIYLGEGKLGSLSSVVDLPHFDDDRDVTFYFDADPVPTFHFDADPNLALQNEANRIHGTIFKSCCPINCSESSGASRFGMVELGSDPTFRVSFNI